MESIRSLIRTGEVYLVEHGVPNARRNAEWLLCHTLGCRNVDLYFADIAEPDSARVEAYRRLLERRGRREPLQYILETTEFMSLPFRTHAGVFIPRPDTEVLVEVAEALLGGRPEPAVCDLCCGSGVIGISLAKRRGARVTAVDVSPEAVELTRANARLNLIDEHVTARRMEAGHFLSLHADTVDRTAAFELIASNPPYVPSADIPTLPPEIRDHEPIASLDGGVDGLDFFHRIIPRLGASLQRGGLVVFELGDDQAPQVMDLLTAHAFSDARIHRDYAGHRRVVSARYDH